MQFMRPVGSPTTNGWSGLAADVADASGVDDATYIASPVSPDSGSYWECDLSGATDPNTDNGLVLRFRPVLNAAAGDAKTVSVRIFRASDNTTVVSQTSSVGYPVGEVVVTLSPAEAAAIASFASGALKVRVSAAGATVPAAADNTMTLTPTASATNYPLQFGRPFRQGEIAHYPQILINGSAVVTQADVKQRWPDTSVRHAILSCLVPSLTANAPVTITFQDQAGGQNGGYLATSGMQAAAYDFDARIALTNGTTKTVSARTMLGAGHYTYWLQGSVCTSIILADHSASRTYDQGFSAGRPFRPIFHATFWPTINKVAVRFIGETGLSTDFSDVTYSLALSTGSASPATVYTKTSFTHCAATRWTKTAWINTAPASLAIRHNLAYLASTTLVPNFDTTKVVPEATMVSEYAAWLASSRDIRQAGLWQTSMDAVGGRRDIGMYPAWVVRWLYSGDVRMREMSVGHAELAGSWAMHFRETSASRTTFVPHATDTNALGRVVSIGARPTLFTYDSNNYLFTYFVAAGDKFTIPSGGATTLGGWTHDNAHQPDPYSILYLLTGEFYYLEQLWFWAAWNATVGNPDGTSGNICRGPSGDYGIIVGQTRGHAWGLRQYVHAAAHAPDDAPEQTYFETLITDTVAGWEGLRGVTSPLSSHPAYVWGVSRQSSAFTLGIPPLHFWDGGIADSDGSLNQSVCLRATSYWMHNMHLMVLGRAEELGYDTSRLKAWLGASLTGTLTDAGFTPYAVAAYRTPTALVSTNANCTTWAQVLSAFATSFSSSTFTTSLADAEHGYACIAMAAASYVTDLANGSASWAFMEANARPSLEFDANPKWAIVPRS